MDDYFDYDPCEDCIALGDDYEYDADGELVSRCYDCPLRKIAPE